MFSVYVLAGSSVVSLDFLPPGWKATENSTELPSEVLKENWRMEGDLMSIGTSKSSPGARLCTRDSMRGAGSAARSWGGGSVRTAAQRTNPIQGSKDARYKSIRLCSVFCVLTSEHFRHHKTSEFSVFTLRELRSIFDES